MSVNAATVHPETKSPAKSQWKQVEHEVQEARRQLTRIKAKKCLKAVQAMEGEATKQRWVCSSSLGWVWSAPLRWAWLTSPGVGVVSTPELGVADLPWGGCGQHP